VSRDERAQTLRDAGPNTWIALSGDESRVVGKGATYSEAVDRAKENGEEDPLLIKTPEAWNDLVL